MVLAQSIDLHSLESKSSYKCQAHRRGAASEFQVGKALLNAGFKLHAHRLRTHYCEVDWVASRAHVVFIVEVKSEPSPWSCTPWLYESQQKRLENLLEDWLQWRKEVQILVATVSHNGEVSFFGGC